MIKTMDFTIYFKVISKEETNVFYGLVEFGRVTNDSVFTDAVYRSGIEEDLRKGIAETFSVDISQVFIVTKEEYLAENEDNDNLINVDFNEKGNTMDKEDIDNLEYLKTVANN